MSIPEISREELHFRNIDMRGFRRSDGLFEVEGRVTDRKTYEMETLLGGRKVPAQQPLHDMGVRIIFDETMLVHDIGTFMSASPYGICPGGGEALQALKGEKMSSGWSRIIREKLANAHSCTHLVQLLSPMATVAFQTLSAVRRFQAVQRDADGRPLKIDSCYAYGAERELVREHWPEFQKQPSAPKKP